MNIVEPILFQCKLNPLTPAICAPGSDIGSVNYGTLEKLHSQRRAVSARECGIAPGQIVAIFVRDTILHASLSLRPDATGRGRRIPAVGLGSRRGYPGRRHPHRRPAALCRLGATILGVDHSWLAGDGSAAGLRAHLSSERGTTSCRIVLTYRLHRRSEGHRVLSQDAGRADRSLHLFEGATLCPLPALLLRSQQSERSPGFRLRDLALLSRGATIYFLGDDPSDILQALDLQRRSRGWRPRPMDWASS